MTDLVSEHVLRETLRTRADSLDPTARGRVLAVDYRPRRHRVPLLPVIGAGGVAGVAAAVVAVVTLGSTAAPAFAGWSASPTNPLPGQTAAALSECGSGTPTITDTRGPYTAAIYAGANSTRTCLQGDSVSIDSASSGGTPTVPGDGQIVLNGAGSQANGNALTLVDGRVGAGVTAVTVVLSDGSSVHATVSNGWYLAWWPGTSQATHAEITTATGTSSETFPSGPGTPTCPAGAHCAYGFGSSSAAGTSAASSSAGGEAPSGSVSSSH